MSGRGSASSRAASARLGVTASGSSSAHGASSCASTTSSGIRALARRSRDPLPPVLERHDLRLDPARREATRGGHFLRLTRKEFGVLEVLLAADGAVVSAEDLLERVWDEHTDPFTKTVRVTIMNLRRKLGRQPLIETVTGVGYRL